MCGISLIVNPGNIADRDLIKKMNEVIIHRGPDGEGFYFEDEFGLAMGHRRLAIIDVTENGHQPMHWLDKYVVIFNGEIYNYIEIKEELIGIGCTFRSQSDTEVILAAYHYWGLDCFNRFNGMWAICLYDKIKKDVILSRDRFGIKPLYYSLIGNKLIVGSEIKQFIRTGIIHPKPNYSVLMNYLIFGFIEHNQETFFESIISLAPSHYLIYNLNSKKVNKVRYFKLAVNDQVRALSEEEAINGYMDLFKDSIKLRLRSDVKVGTCLSGGLDSSSISAYASLMYASQVEQFVGITASSVEKRNDEVKWAEEVAKSSKLEWHVTQPKEEDFEKYLCEVIKCQEEPFGSPSVLMQFFVFKKSADIHCTVLLDGQGGDETLLGYERYFAPYLNLFNPIERSRQAILLSENSKLGLIQVILYYIYFNLWFVRKFIAKRRHKGIKAKYFNRINWDQLRSKVVGSKSIDEFQRIELESTCLPHLLKYEDKNSMWHSIETRLPFLDYRVVEFAHSINPKFKIKDGWTKSILRKGAIDILPSSILWRKNKYGFEAPNSIWMQNKEGLLKVIKASPLIREITNYVPEDMNEIEVIWRYYNIALWEKEFGINVGSYKTN